jgi:shikimate dehydrogenase
MPYKEKVIELLDGLDKSAEQCGAVNTVVTTEKGLIGYNTDGMGFLNSFIEEFKVSPEGKTLLLIGAGGAAKAVAFAFLNAGVSKIIVYNNSQSRAMSLVERVEKFFPGKCEWRPLNKKPVPPDGIAEADIIVNATKVGMKGEMEDQSLVLPDSFHPGQLVCDVIYNPPETKLLADAKKAGCKTLSGDGMLVYQAAAAFKLWFGIDSDVELMKRTFKNYFGF